MRNRADHLVGRSQVFGRRRGMALVYVIVAMMAMVGFCSLAVDFGRVETAKTALRSTADAVAMYAVQGISDGTYVARAIQAGAENRVDGSPVVVQSGDVTLGTWTLPDGPFSAGGSSPNAIQVKLYRTKARGTAIPLTFAALVGQSSCNVTATAIALFSQQSATPYVSTLGNPWLSGEPTGTIGSETDAGYEGPDVNSEHPWQHDIAGPPGTKLASGQYYNSPVQVSVNVTSGSIITLTNVTGQGTNDPDNAMNTANGDDLTGNPSSDADDWVATGSPAEEHGISDVTMPHNAIVGVFLNNNLPDTDSAAQPAALDFSTQTERDYTVLSPQLRQPFYAGNGQTSTGVQQQIVVPEGATRLFLGTMDGHEWSNNVGGYNATVTSTSISLVQ
jgi:hypothetical protein